MVLDSINSYPEIAIPSRLSKINEILPPIPDPPEEPKAPQKPIEPVDRSHIANYSVSWISGLVAFIVLVGIIDKGSSFWIVCFFLISSGVCYSSFISVKEKTRLQLMLYQKFKKDNEEYFKNIERYNKNLLPEWRSAVQEYNRSILEIRGIDSVSRFRNSLKRDFCLQATPAVILSSSRRHRGVSEDVFCTILQRDFQVYKNAKIGKCRPDLLITETSFPGVAIFIDEPYSGSSKFPTHYLGFDRGREGYEFKRNGWPVIRFAEEQVVCVPDLCVKFIKMVWAEYLEPTTKKISPNELSIPKYFFLKKWTREDSLRMARRSFRNEYLPPELVSKLVFE